MQPDDKIKIRRGVAADAEALTELQRSTCLVAYGHIFPPELYPFPIEATKEHWRQTLTAHEETVLVAGRKNVPAGVIAYRSDYVHSLFVAPDEWGKGIGGLLHDAAVRELASGGIGRCNLWVMEENHRARRFYEARGWVPDGRTDTSRFPPHPRLLAYQLVLPVDRGLATPTLTGSQGSE